MGYEKIRARASERLSLSGVNDRRATGNVTVAPGALHLLKKYIRMCGFCREEIRLLPQAVSNGPDSVTDKLKTGR